MHGSNYVAGATITPGTFVKLSTSADNTVLPCGSGDLPIGIATISQKLPPIYNNGSEAADAGDPVTVFGPGDVCMALAASGGFTHGDKLGPDSTAAAQTITSTGVYIGALALQSTTGGNYGRVQVVIFKN